MGFEALRDAVEGLYFEGEIDYAKTPTLSLARQKVSVENAIQGVERAISCLEMSMPADIAGLDVEGAISALRELDGRQVSEMIVSGIFSKFCVGK
jgi:tRNA modification GTPase